MTYLPPRWFLLHRCALLHYFTTTTLFTALQLLLTSVSAIMDLTFLTRISTYIKTSPKRLTADLLYTYS
jgi:hypothetical protein